ncbi:unnamed protein product, partial [marine sediment metagenome]
RDMTALQPEIEEIQSAINPNEKDNLEQPFREKALSRSNITPKASDPVESPKNKFKAKVNWLIA